jgi:hypothetical protein
MRVVALVVLVGVVVGAAVAIWSAIGKKSITVALCRVTAGASQYTIDLDQAANATTITAVGKRLGLPDHAVTIALATALQESQLHNVAYGDRDSLGLFQQRPSQGWGTAAQVMNPSYAAAAFFKALARVPAWQTMSVTNAAQAVQHSNAPQAYALWEPLARTLAITTTGESAAGLACQFSVSHSKLLPASPMPALTKELGPVTLDTRVSAKRGWMIAGWLVGHADQYRITTVRFDDQQWTPHGSWTATAATGPGVQITQSPLGHA